jgi:GntR family histidine utilization transcriptional repressor
MSHSKPAGDPKGAGSRSGRNARLAHRDQSHDNDKHALPAFARIKAYIKAEIQCGRWMPGDVIPAEESLAVNFGVSRMTVNRAVKELAAERLLTRVQGSGTFVAKEKYQATLVEIKNIADEIRSRNHRHRSMLHRLEKREADALLAGQFGAPVGDVLYHSVIVHFENDEPIQVEDRWVNPVVAPDYLQLDFSLVTPNEYLMICAPLEGATYRIESLLPTKEIALMLSIKTTEPCLLLHRTTYSQGKVASTVTMWHPGSRYQFTGSF